MSTHREPYASKPFSTADHGTPEAQWLNLLDQSPQWSPGEGALVVVAPHPDDEVLGAGGLIQSWAAAGRSITVLSVTDGEAADTNRPDLDLIRRRELREALRTLTPLHVNIERSGLPDGKVSAHANRLRAVIQEHARPGTTLIAPYQHDGHPDHEIVGRLCAEVAHEARIPIASYPVWAWHHADPVKVKALPWVRFTLSTAARRAKTRALQCFVSQLRPPTGSPIVPPHVLAHFQRPYEAFVL